MLVLMYCGGLLFIYYLFVIMVFLEGDFKSRQSFLNALIPFGGIITIIKEKWNSLPSNDKEKT